jgi:hypothetical protein
VGKQQVTFAVSDKDKFDLDEVKTVIEKTPRYKVGAVLSGP